MVHFSTTGAFLPKGRTSFFLRTCFVPQYRHLTQLCMTDWGLPFLSNLSHSVSLHVLQATVHHQEPQHLSCSILLLCRLGHTYPKYVLFLSGAFLSWRFPEYHKWFDRLSKVCVVSLRSLSLMAFSCSFFLVKNRHRFTVSFLGGGGGVAMFTQSIQCILQSFHIRFYCHVNLPPSRSYQVLEHLHFDLVCLPRHCQRNKQRKHLSPLLPFFWKVVGLKI